MGMQVNWSESPSLTCVSPQDRLARLEQDIQEEEMRQQQEALRKVDAINEAERRRHAPIDDSKIVDEMFGFINEEGEDGAGAAPSGFSVSNSSLTLKS